MKHIVKDAEPAELLDWKDNDKMYLRGRPNWDRIPAAVKGVLRENLRNEQGHICCYCERYMQIGDYHIEHIKPKGKTSQYQEFLAEYDNLLCSCQPEGIRGDPLHCGMGKENWYDPVNYVSPLDAECEGRFKYTFNGGIEPADPKDLGAAMTIDKLKLFLPKLNALRKSTIAAFLEDDLSPEELEKYVSGYLKEKDQNNGQYNPFYTTIKFLFT